MRASFQHTQGRSIRCLEMRIFPDGRDDFIDWTERKCPVKFRESRKKTSVLLIAGGEGGRGEEYGSRFDHDRGVPTNRRYCHGD